MIKIEVLLLILFLILYQSFHILDEPSVHMNGEVVRVRTGDRVHLNCTVKGIPTPDISWFRNQNNIRRRIETGNNGLSKYYYYVIAILTKNNV